MSSRTRYQAIVVTCADCGTRYPATVRIVEHFVEGQSAPTRTEKCAPSGYCTQCGSLRKVQHER